MDHPTMTDELDRRLRAVRPPAAEVDHDAYDGDLLARVRQLPREPRRRVPRTIAVPVAVGATAAATAAVMLAGPGDVGGPSPASAITRTLRWLDPPAGSVLHARSVETEGTRTVTREFWEAAGDPARQRELVQSGAATFEVSGGAIFDPATNTIYDGGKVGDGEKVVQGEGPAVDKRRAADLARAADDAAKEAQIEAEGAKTGAAGPVDADEAAAKAAKLAAGGAAPEKQPPGIAPAPRTGQPGDIALPPGDPIVAKVRTLLELGHATVLHRERHDGVSTWAIGLKEGIGGPSWRLWVDASSGRPIELRDPGRDANKPAQVIRWQTYEVLRQGGDATALLTLRGAHPTAQVVHDPAQWQAAEQRLALVRP